MARADVVTDASAVTCAIVAALVGRGLVRARIVGILAAEHRRAGAVALAVQSAGTCAATGTSRSAANTVDTVGAGTLAVAGAGRAVGQSDWGVRTCVDGRIGRGRPSAAQRRIRGLAATRANRNATRANRNATRANRNATRANRNATCANRNATTCAARVRVYRRATGATRAGIPRLSTRTSTVETDAGTAARAAASPSLEPRVRAAVRACGLADPELGRARRADVPRGAATSRDRQCVNSPTVRC
jgi:hypothetical protein